MLFRILGAISLFLGGLFLLVALLIMLPFLDNFNTSLLLLAGIFGVIGWVLLTTGWQLLHPPAAVFVEVPRRRPAQSAEAEGAVAEGESPETAPAVRTDDPGEAEVTGPAAPPEPAIERDLATQPEPASRPDVPTQAPLEAEPVGRAAEPEVETGEEAPAPVPPPRPERTFVSLGEPDPTLRPAPSDAAGDDEDEPPQDANGGRAAGPGRGRFKKRGAAVPPSREGSDS